MKILRLVVSTAAGLSAVLSSVAMAGGFEKNIMWSGEYGGKGGAAVSTVRGAEALYWNPARLVKGEASQDVSINLSPTISQYSAPVTTDADSQDSEQNLSPIFGLLYRNRFSENMAVGVGLYVSGGTSVTYKDVPFSASAVLEQSSSLNLTELAIGLGYDLNPDWSVGLAWRVGMVSAAYSLVSGLGGGNYAHLDFQELEATSIDGYKIGVSYNPTPEWGIGLNLRSRLGFKAEGSVDRVLYTPSAGSTVTADASIASEFPQQISLGGHYQLSEKWVGFLEFVQTSYGKIEKLFFDVQGGVISDVSVTTNWNDQTNIRIAGEYTGWSMPLRLGYVYTSAVVPEERALSTLSTPAIAHTLTAGSTYKFDETWQLNYALDYSFSSGEVASATANDGDYSSSAYALHLGMNVSF